MYSEESFFFLFFFLSNQGTLFDLFVCQCSLKLFCDEPIIFAPESACRSFEHCGILVGWAHRGELHGQPPGGAVGEGKWTGIKQAATETLNVCWVYEAVVSSQPLTMREETPFSQTFHAVICLKHGPQ